MASRRPRRGNLVSLKSRHCGSNLGFSFGTSVPSAEPDVHGRPIAAGSPRAPRGGSTSAMPGRRCSAGSGPARRAASSSSGSRTSTPPAPDPSSPTRSSPISTWLGLTFDGPPVLPEPTPGAVPRRVRAASGTAGRVYPCLCTRGEIARAVSAPARPRGRWPALSRNVPRALSAEESAERARTRPPAWRFRPREGSTEVRRPSSTARSSRTWRREVGDFVVLRNDGVPSYQLAVVVDDADIGHHPRAPRRRPARLDAAADPALRGARAPRARRTPTSRCCSDRTASGSPSAPGRPASAELRERGVAPERLIGLLAGWAGLGDGRPASARRSSCPGSRSSASHADRSGAIPIQVSRRSCSAHR